MTVIGRARFVGLIVALLAVVVGPVGAVADSPPGGPSVLERVVAGVPVEVASLRWTAEASVTASLAPPLALVPSDGKVHRVNIGGRRIAIWCQGVGSPTVILEHGIGYGVDSDSWEDVQEGVAKETRVCRYDRAYVGESDDAKPGRSMPDLAEDLVDLMEAALIPGPYILVGHSFGGLVVRNFAKVHPKSVVGMVLVDGSPRSAIVGLNLGSERLSSTKVLAQLTALEKPGLLGHIPLIVITRGIGAGTLWRAEQAKEVKLSTSGRQVIATSSDHWIQLRQPDLVIRQILVVLHTLRRYA
jgi:hypothetical protein